MLVIIFILMKISDFNLKTLVEHIHREDLKPQDTPEVFYLLSLRKETIKNQNKRIVSRKPLDRNVGGIKYR